MKLKLKLILLIIACVLSVPVFAEPVEVTQDNFQEAETVINYQNWVDKGADGKLLHVRELTPAGKVATVRMNSDTLYSVAIIELGDEPVFATIPDTDVFTSFMVVDELAYNPQYEYKPGRYEIKAETRYVMIAYRIGVTDRHSEDDLKMANKVQDMLLIEGAGKTPYNPTQFNQEQLTKMRDELRAEFNEKGKGEYVYGAYEGQVDEYKRLWSTADAWGGIRDQINIYNNSPELSAASCQRFSFDDPQVDSFFSFTLYDLDGYLMEGATHISNSKLTPNADGTYTISINCTDGINQLNTDGQDYTITSRAYNTTEATKSWIPFSDFAQQ